MAETPTVLRAQSRAVPELPTLAHFIDGQHVAGNATGTFTVMDPARGVEICRVPLAGADEVGRAVEAARRALPAWAGLTPRERSGLLLRLADAVEADAQRLRALEGLNCGKPLAVATDDVESAVDTFRFMAGAGRTGSTIAAGDYVADTTSLILREPVGVVAMVTPWNYPLLMGVWKVAAALTAGNTVILKPSEVTPLTTLRLAELAADILPAGVLNVVLGDGPGVGTELARHEGIDMVALTGSVRAGVSVATEAAADLKRVHLELGGKAPVIVRSDADVQQAAAAVAEAGLWNSGQECGAACRVIVHEDVADDLVGRLVRVVQGRRLADPEVDQENALGPMIYHQHFTRVMDMLAGAMARGATVCTGGHGDDSHGYWIEPTVLRVAQGDEITVREVFGPVITVETYTDDAEAVRRANAVEYGLTGSVFTRDVGAALRIAKALDFGSVNVNTHLALPTEMPWAGFKHSGYGRDLSAYAVDDFSRTKHVAIHHG